MHLVTPNTIKADIQFVVSVVIVLGFPVSDTLTAALLGASALIAVAVNLAEAHTHVGAKVTNAVESARADIAALLPAIESLVHGLPGKTAAEVTAALDVAKAGPKPVKKAAVVPAPKAAPPK